MTTAPKAPIDVLLLSDGRPGHFNLSDGIVAALGRLRALTVRRLEVRRPGWLPARLLSAVVNAGPSPEQILRYAYGMDPGAIGRPEVIVSAGGDTLAANVAAARLSGAANIFYGSLRRYRAADFALAMTSYAAQVDAPNRLMWLKPSKLDPDAALHASAGPTSGGGDVSEGAYASGERQAPTTLGLIIGGNSGTVRFREADWSRLFDLVGAVAARTGCGWIVANGPRTPADISERISWLARDGEHGVRRFLDYRKAGPGTLGTVLAEAQGVVCTADSSSMLSETVWMRRPVLAVAPAVFSLPANEQAYRDWLAQNGWAAQRAIADLRPETLADTFRRLSPLTSNPLDDLATELQRRLPRIAA